MRWSLPARALAMAVAAALGLGATIASGRDLALQMEQYRASGPKTILELQPFRTETSVLARGRPELRLVSLGPGANAWFLLTIGAASEGRSYHLENSDPAGQGLELSGAPEPALLITGREGVRRCVPWSGSPSVLETARRSGLPFAPLCDGRLYLRNAVEGSRSALETVTDFLRDQVWKGEEVVGFVKDTFFADSFAQPGRNGSGAVGPSASDGPVPARIDPALAGMTIVPAEFGIGLEGVTSGEMAAGAWYAAAGLTGVYASAVQPRAIAPEVLRGPRSINPLEDVEAGAVDFMVAFDLGQFDLHFALGTDHPRLGWSPRPPDSVSRGGLPGPDGVGTPAPLVPVGMVTPALAGRTVAAFTGGFKRDHGAFKYGVFATRNQGSHYGFIEQGVIFSKLQPGLATLFVLDDGEVRMKTWAEADDAILPSIRFARQNGVPLLETDPSTGRGVPGALVTRWGAGNWSGSADAKLRTLRAGACLQETGRRRFLVYGYFSTATPSAMARTFQAYGCRYAMLLDMNALEHTYLALYVRSEGELRVEHLIPGMTEVDKADRDGKLIPRFLGFPDNRDFFYLTLKEAPQ